MGEIIAVVNQKGGIGKTTFSLNASYELSKLGKKILLIDNDPQGNSTSALYPPENEIEHYLNECYCNHKNPIIEKIILQSEAFEIDFAPSCILLAGVEQQLQSKFGRETYLKKILEPIKSNYDYILIDCSPSLGILTANALVAADKFIIATRPEKFALNGIQMVLETVELIKEDLNSNIELSGVCITWMPYSNVAKMHRKTIEEHFKDKLFNNEISCSKDIEEAHTKYLPLSKHNKTCKTAIQYQRLIKEVLQCL